MSVTNKELVATAKGYLGKLRYVFGGNDIENGKGDCSDFTEHVFAVHGIEIGGDTSAQYSQGIPIGREEIEAGDLVFFKNTYDSGKIDGVSHVGIAVSKNDFIHLSSSGCKISSLNSTYYNEHYLLAKRLNEVSYVGSVVNSTVSDSENVTETPETKLVWWGDIVKVVVVVLVLIGGVALLSMSILGNVKAPKINDLLNGGNENE